MTQREVTARVWWGIEPKALKQIRRLQDHHLADFINTVDERGLAEAIQMLPRYFAAEPVIEQRRYFHDA